MRGRKVKVLRKMVLLAAPPGVAMREIKKQIRIVKRTAHTALAGKTLKQWQEKLGIRKCN